MRSGKACDLHHSLGDPSPQDLKAIMTQNLIKDIPITVQDVNLVMEIFGPDMGSLRGKTTRKKPIQAINNMIELPYDLTNKKFKLVMYIDIMTINMYKFITTITSKLHYRTIHYLKLKK